MANQCHGKNAILRSRSLKIWTKKNLRRSPAAAAERRLNERKQAIKARVSRDDKIVRPMVQKAKGDEIGLIGYRFIVKDGDIYIIKLNALTWRYRWTIDYDTLDYVVLSIVNARTLEKKDHITGIGVMHGQIDYTVGEHVKLPDKKHGVYFFKDVQMLFDTYLVFDDHMTPAWDPAKVSQRAAENRRAIFNTEAFLKVRKRIEEERKAWSSQVKAIQKALNEPKTGHEGRSSPEFRIAPAESKKTAEEAKNGLLGYRFVIDNNGDIYIMKLEAFSWLHRKMWDYDTLDYVVLSIVNARTLEHAESITGSAVMGRKLDYTVGEHVRISGKKHGAYFLRSVHRLFTTYLYFDENMVPVYDPKTMSRRSNEAFLAVINKEARIEMMKRKTEEDNKWGSAIRAIQKALSE